MPRLYAPAAYASLPTVEADGIAGAGPQTIVRGLRMTSQRAQRLSTSGARVILIDVDGPPGRVFIRTEQELQFGDSRISAMDYLRRVIEPGDLIDGVVTARIGANSDILLESLWIQIRYDGHPRDTTRLKRKKEDGEFALRAKAGEKSERAIARMLVQDYDHRFPPAALTSPGFFTIYYQDKANRKADRKCEICGAVFEIKRRNYDHRIRISHSQSRPWGTENPVENAWHVFDFAVDGTHAFVANSDIACALEREDCYTVGEERNKDQYADINPACVRTTAAPRCISLNRPP